ncbi:MAG TPA: bifunctional diaminohydroxyphosphoribosylaminopyrimidine deaminase/5-amino-6-(5-phosphoribosylamino)uracil reductase RibD [Spirochaetia bacterium]|nr:bifunctional diaminohydroxyphosphoribosylaminopyrimidine deaminase/5-amino-6-(5-phosphoribosylamino)uracil reductase RibD [Spirochaetia bacterium]
MQQALNLATRGLGWTAPNPAVGAVVVRDGRVVGKGFHRQAGTAHAEAIALTRAGEKAAGATLYVTLEPCAHQGRTPPCTDAIILHRVSRVVVAMRDPNTLVDGKGIDRLTAAGITVETGLLEARARRLNEVYVTNMTAGRPFIALKAAASLDGKIATAGGESKWITGEAARTHARRLRGRYDAVVVGARTAEKDDPDLTPRVPEYRDKKVFRVICDSRARLPLDGTLVKTAASQPVIVAVTRAALPAKVQKLAKAGCTVLLVNDDRGLIDLEDLVEKLQGLGITSLLVEGGGELLASFVEKGLYDKLYLFYALRLFGGDTAPSFLRGHGVNRIEDAARFARRSVRFLGDDLLLELYPAGSRFAEGS